MKIKERREEHGVETPTNTHTTLNQRKDKHMVKVKSQEPPPYEPVEPGEYKAKVTEIGIETEGLYGPQVRFVFGITDDEDYKDQTIRGWAALKLDEDGEFTFWEGTKLWDWVTALRGDALIRANGEEFELNDLVGKTCRIMVVTKKKKDGTPTDKIDNVLAPKKGKAAGPAKKQAEMEEEADFSEIDF